MKYLRDFGLERDPFDSALPLGEDVFISRDLERMQDAITRAVAQNQLLGIIGPWGGGKTTTALRYLQTASEQILVVRNVTIDIERLRIQQIQAALIDELVARTNGNETVKRSAAAKIAQLTRLLGRFVVTERKRVVLFLEDGHKMLPETLVNLKRLRELEYAGVTPLLSVIIVSQPQIRSMLSDRSGVEVGGRMKMVELNGLSKDEVPKYVAHRVRSAGGKVENLFTGKSLKAIAQTLHWPQEINKFCGDILEESWELGDVPVTDELVLKKLGKFDPLRTMFDISSMSYSDLTDEANRMFDRKRVVKRHDVMRVMEGGKQDPELRGILMKILRNASGDAGVLYMPDLPGATAEERELLNGILTMAGEIDDLDYEDLARRLGGAPYWTAKRVHDVFAAKEYGLSRLKQLHAELLKQRAAA